MDEINQSETKKTSPKQLLMGLGVLVIIGLVIFGVIMYKNSNKAKHPSESGYVLTTETVFFYATGAAKAIVIEEILYPRNSEFEDESNFSVYYDKSVSRYTVKGVVYAANGFGVKQKKYFTVVLTLGNLDKEKYSYSKVSCHIT